jgi:hypothetical protein
MPRRAFGVVAMASLLPRVTTIVWPPQTCLPADPHVGAADGSAILPFAKPPATRPGRCLQCAEMRGAGTMAAA